MSKSDDNKTSDEQNSSPWFPLLPLRDVVVYPLMVIPLFVGRSKSVNALEKAMHKKKQIVLVTQKKSEVDEPDSDDLYSYGTLGNILQMMRLPDGTLKVLIEGVNRIRIDYVLSQSDHYAAQITVLEEPEHQDREAEALVRALLGRFEQYAKLNKKIPPEVLSSLSGSDDASRIADSIAAHMAIKIDNKQAVLGHLKLAERAEYLMNLLEAEIDLLKIEKRIRGRVKSQMEKSQREYYLNEQVKAIQRELGDMENAPNEGDDLGEKIKKAGMPQDIEKKAMSELNKLKMMAPISAEATVVRNYIDWLVNVPWRSGRRKTSTDLKRARQVLDEDHYGLEKVKDRILEQLAVQRRVRHIKGSILCLVGPPGVGKTSLGRSIARATKREFVRISLGGVRDEAEIRGHRRTYIGAMPGKIIQSMAKVGRKNPLFLLDEIDKIVADFRGDPAAALLEVLDPEQNNTFNDHYMEVDYDLSEVMFVTTANTIMHIPLALLDRMEIIRLSGYTEDEKVHIAENYLLPKQMKETGLKKGELMVNASSIRDIIRYYTREAGVRGLEREVANICRKTVKNILTKEDKEGKKVVAANAKNTKNADSKAAVTTTVITPSRLEKLLGVRRYRYGRADELNRVGQVTGLAWTETGGDLLTVEAAIVTGKGKTNYTGQLGDVMKESIHAAMTVARGRSSFFGLDSEYFQSHDFHIHVPEGATPKDGPSAGVTMVTALVSALTEIPVRSNIAMTGEITLRGEILPIGGLKEKLLAALRGGIDTVLIPEENERELREIPRNIKKNLNIKPLRWIDQVLEIALQNPLPNKANEKSKAGKENIIVPPSNKPARRTPPPRH